MGSDRSQLASTATAAKEAVGELEAIADRGNFSREEIKACDDAGITGSGAPTSELGVTPDGPGATFSGN